jgi:cbb3-type cytochrome oxidase subunit 3
VRGQMPTSHATPQSAVSTRLSTMSITLPPSIISNFHYERESIQHWRYEKLAIAAIALLSILTFAGACYLMIWYFLRRQARQRRRQEAQGHDMFSQSAVSLAEDTSKTLDEFLMTDVQPQRTSIIRGPGHSPSITMVFEDSYLDSPPHPYLTSCDTSFSSSVTTLTPVNTLTPIATTDSGPSIPTSSMVAEVSSGTQSSSSTRRTSMSLNQSIRSSQVVEGTSTNTPTGSNPSPTSFRSIFSQNAPQSLVSPLSSRSSGPNPPIPGLRLTRSDPQPSSRGHASQQARRGVLDPPFIVPSVLVDISSELNQASSSSARAPGSSPFRHSSPA